jgi:hypothetical protein
VDGGDAMAKAWQCDETRLLSTDEAWEAARLDLGFARMASRPSVAVVLHEVVIYETKKWFGPAEIRLDALS